MVQRGKLTDQEFNDIPPSPTHFDYSDVSFCSVQEDSQVEGLTNERNFRDVEQLGYADSLDTMLHVKNVKMYVR